MSYLVLNQIVCGCRLFGAVDDIFCMFQGTIVNVAVLKQQYGLSKGANEVNIIIEAYRTLRDRGPYPADQVVRDISGKFAFVLYDCSTKSVFMAAVSELLLYFTFFFVALAIIHI
jgi:asparagine synthetase B (glutamine-hydrolysing)